AKSPSFAPRAWGTKRRSRSWRASRSSGLPTPSGRSPGPRSTGRSRRGCRDTDGLARKDPRMEPTFTEQALRRLHELGLALPDSPPMPAGLYAPFRLHRGTGYLAAQVSGYGPGAPLGRIGHELTVEQGVGAARRAALNALARIHEALGGFERLVGLLHVGGYV